jgi:hypothetical protein
MVTRSSCRHPHLTDSVRSRRLIPRSVVTDFGSGRWNLRGYGSWDACNATATHLPLNARVPLQLTPSVSHGVALSGGSLGARASLLAASLNIDYPMLFEISNETTGRKSHCGVLEFIAEEGVVYMPHWVSSVRIRLHRLLAPFQCTRSSPPALPCHA